MDQAEATPVEEGETPPPEVEHDAVAELERIHDAQKFDATPEQGDYDPSYGISTPALPYEPPVVGLPETPVVEPAPQLKTLEDLYASYPKLGDGQYYLRVVRKHPAVYSGLRVAGFLEDVYERLSMGDFASRFGGHTFEVSVRGPGRTTAIDADGRVEMRTLKTIRIEIPGAPVKLGPNTNGEGNMSTQMPFRDNPQVEMKRMEIQQEQTRRREQREMRLQDQVLSRPVMSPEMWDAMERAAEKRSGEVKSIAAETIGELRDQLKRYQEALSAKDDTVQGLREKMVSLQTDSAMKWREEESRQVRELKDRNESEIRRIKEDQASTIARISDENKRLVADMSDRFGRERDQIQKQEKVERDRIREDAARRERQLIDDSRMREENMRTNYESRLAEQGRSLEREIRSIKEQRDREVLSVQTTESTKSTLSEKTAKIQIEMMRGELTRVELQLDSARRDLQSLTARHQKTTEEAIMEAHQLASMTGFGKAEEGELDWKRGVVSALKGLIDKAPDIAKGLGEARESNRIAAARAQHQARVAQQRAQVARERAMLHQHAAGAPPQMAPHAQQAQQQRRVPRPAPPGVQTWDASQGPPDPGAAVGLPPPITGPPPAQPEETAHHFGSVAPPAATVAPLQEASAPAVSPMSFGETAEPSRVQSQPALFHEVPKPRPAPQPPGQSPQPQLQPLPGQSPQLQLQPLPGQSPQPPPAPGQNAETQQQQQLQPLPGQNAETQQQQQQQPIPGQVNITDEQISEFAEKLDLAIVTGLETPEGFAQKFVADVGPEVTGQIITAIGPDQLVDAVQAHPDAKGTAIVTREGRIWVRQLWDEVRKVLDSRVHEA